MNASAGVKRCLPLSPMQHSPRFRMQASKCCVIGHPKSFFTLYKPVLAAGQTVCQLDRDGHLTAAATAGTPGAAKQLAAALQQACAAASCVLVPAELVGTGRFPLAAFQQVVVYASEPATQAALQPHLSQLACPLHFLEVPLPSLSAPSAQPPQQAAGTVAVGMVAGPGQRTAAAGAPAAAATAAAAQGVARVQHASQVAPPAAAQRAPPAGSRDWPIIVSSDPCRPIRWGWGDLRLAPHRTPWLHCCVQ